MAKFDATYACGHTGTVQIYGPTKDRDRELGRIEARLCDACYAAKRDADNAAANAAAAEKSAELALPALTGVSERQIAYATTVRLAAVERVRKVEGDVLAKSRPYLSDTAYAELRDAAALLVDEVLGQTDAGWWLDNKDRISEASAHMLPTDHYLDAGVLLGVARKRGLIPSYDAALAEYRARGTAALTAVAAAIEDGSADVSWTAGTLTVAAGGHVLTRSAGSGSAKLDGAVVGLKGRLADLTAEMVRVRRQAEADAEREKLHATLVGRTVAEVAKKGTDLTVTLDDGRKLIGKSSREGWTLTKLHPFGWLDAGHPEVERLAAEAKAWHKANR